MKQTILVVLLLSVVCTAFGRHKHKKKGQSGNEIKSVTMQRTGCYGRCPTYNIEITSDGKAIYTGIRFTDDSGIFIKNIGTQKAMEVIDQFVTYRADTCKDTYENRIPDLPGINMMIKYADHTKTINNANAGPGFLRLLARQMDEAGKKTDDSWKRAK